MNVSKSSFEDHYPQRPPAVDNLFKSMMTSYIPQIVLARKIFGMGSRVFAEGTEYLSGRAPHPTPTRRACRGPTR